MDDLGLHLGASLVTALVLIVMCFRLGLTVFDYFGIRHR